MDAKEKFGYNLRKVREKKGITQETLAKKVDLHRNYISEIECGKRNVSIKVVEKLAKALDVTIQKLFHS